MDSASTSFMFGSALGAFSGIVNPISFSTKETLNVALHMGVNSVAFVGCYLGQTAYTDGNLNNISIGGLIISAIGGASAGYLPSSTASMGYYNYISIQGAMACDMIANARRGRYIINSFI